MPEENLHATIAFLGGVHEEKVEPMTNALVAAAGTVSPFETALGGLGAFPSERRARVVWAGLSDPDGAFASMAGTIHGALAPLGFEPDHRPYRPHVTLARLRTPARVDLGGVAVGPIPFRVGEVVLFESQLGRPHARYEPRATLPFGS